MKRKIADLVYYVPPIALVWLPGDVNVCRLENVGSRLTLLAANFCGFGTSQNDRNCWRQDEHTSARLRPSKDSSCCWGGGS